MATDYEAVYESVMKYTRTTADNVDTQDKLARYLRQNDRQNKMSDRLIQRLVETEGAKEDIEAARNNNPEEVRQHRIATAQRNEHNVTEERRHILTRTGAKQEGRIKEKSTGTTHAVYNNGEGKLVYYDQKVNRAREVKVNDKNEYVATGRFAKRWVQPQRGKE